MANENPYESRQAIAKAPGLSKSVFYWRIPFLLVAAAIASVPYYGFFVHAARDSQETALLILLSWFLTWIFGIGSIILAVARPPATQTVRLAAIFLTMYLFIAGFVGWGGVGNAIAELIAG